MVIIRQYLRHYRTNKYFKGAIGNQALPSLHRRALQIKLTVPLNIIFTKNVKLGLNVNHKVGKLIKLETRNLKIEIL